ncbi:DegT/DnrJ/EryC1/StrS aminotransferase family protein [Caulobacter sp. S45]|uniref:DegT/DnrJ/EryC1/StrS family aminotransferase n=1 Tax=Caulobacter sp. S45 TaxID=1641861 RepID=UPI00131C05B8|nr:DegT/DnrJ/EryC1/StrS family aminotransferase [Caulobacter sp. S45]
MIYVYQPDLSGREREYLLDAFDSSWISSKGEYVDRFAKNFESYTGIKHATVVSNGTVALHLALHCLGLAPGDEVIVPSFTYIASVNTIVQTGAVPVFADSNAHDWLLDVGHVESLITDRTRAIMAVHLYGAICDMDSLCALAERYGLKIIEDCAEALGSTYRGRHVGSFGAVGTFSFFGNKTVTTGEGGMVTTNDAALAERLTIVKGQGQDPSRRYWHSELGFNYRMTNLAASIGVAQLERIDSILARKREIGCRYRVNLVNSGVRFQDVPDHVVSSDWLVSLLVPDGVDREVMMAEMEGSGIETRPVFYCAHQMPPHFRADLSLPVAQDIAQRGISLPSYPGLDDDQVDFICDAMMNILQKAKRRSVAA